MAIVFKLRPHREEALPEQLARTLQKRTDEESRTRYPRLWAITDRLSGADPGPGKKKRWRGITLLIIGVFLLVPGLVRPGELMLPLIAGAAAVTVGILELLPEPKRHRDPFRRAAQKLMGLVERIPEGQFEVAFLEEAMTITHLPSDTVARIPYGELECAVESEDLLLLVHGEQITVLVKSDLSSGTPEELEALLTDRVSLLRSE